ncbi:MAG: hypothetical protein PHY73_08780 [Candidatus Omnitrophica bacterium]|nr:hypothetical protein [Candidatus Omnitrophota bacterium]
MMTDEKNRLETEEFAELLSKLEDQAAKDFIYGVVKGMVLSMELTKIQPAQDEDSESHVLGKAS